MNTKEQIVCLFNKEEFQTYVKMNDYFEGKEDRVKVTGPLCSARELGVVFFITNQLLYDNTKTMFDDLILNTR